MNEPDAILLLRVVATAELLLVVCIVMCAGAALAPKIRIGCERLQIWWRDYRRPIAQCHYCEKPFRCLRAFIKHRCPLAHPECSDL